MIGSFRNFSKSKFAGVLVFIMIIPFVFWGMGGMFSSGNTNNIAKSIANPVNIPKYIVGIKFDKTKIENPNTIVIEVFNIATPTVE